ncbi:hypothetical protein CTAYLR_006480 [Chrysophaeum taylorii]|uniref:EF-hand domain-containing protein n=1 Tax=Chrysophaeum taylorii TaxID=2483200 RepID=A0AAD7UMT7_9STRA|nr:hypothetical protein CTAYLR_006480 [Chrysophaeum taylorii]
MLTDIAASAASFERLRREVMSTFEPADFLWDTEEAGLEDDEDGGVEVSVPAPAAVAGVESVTCVPRTGCGRRQFLVHERDAQDFWNLRRWALRATVVLYRYEATGDSRPIGVCDLERCAVGEAEEAAVSRLLLGDDEVVEARFEDAREKAAWLEAVAEASPRSLAAAATEAIADRDAARTDAAASAARAEEAEAEARSLRKSLALAREDLAAAARRLDALRDRFGVPVEIAVDRLAATTAAETARRVEAEALLATATEAARRETASLRTRLAGADAALSEKDAERCARDLVERDHRKKATTERKLLVKEIRDLRRQVRRGKTASDARDRVAKFWDDDDVRLGDDNDAPLGADDTNWLFDTVLRDDDDDDDDDAERAAPRIIKRDDPRVVVVRDLGNSAATHGLTQEQIAFQQRHRLDQGTTAAAQAAGRLRELRDRLRRRPVRSANNDNDAAASSAAAELRRQAQALREEAAKLEAAMQQERNVELQAELDRFFSEADADGDGVVTLEELRAALRRSLVDESENSRAASKASELLDSEARVLAILQELDTNADGVLQREEFVPLADFRAKLERDYRAARDEEREQQSAALFDRTAADRLDAFESVANKTSPLTNLAAAVCYLLPTLDGVPIDAIVTATEPNPLTALIAGAYATYRALPASSIVVFLILSTAAGNAAAPRLIRFAARHAIILDLVAALALPLAYRFTPPSVELVTGGLFELAVATCVVAALLGINADFLPGTGTLTKYFIDEFDANIRRFIGNATAAEFGMFMTALKPDANATRDDK